MASHSHIRDAVHQRLAAKRICTHEYARFLRARHDLPQLVVQLSRKMTFMLEHALITEAELMTLIEDPDLDLTATHAQLFVWFVKNQREAPLDWLLAKIDVSEHFPDAVQWAVRHGASDVLRVLLQHGASGRHNDNAPLRYAAFHGHAGVVQQLLSAGADASARNHEAARFARLAGHHALASALDEVHA